MSPAEPAFQRAARLAKTLFDALDATIVLIGPEGVWRSRHHPGLPERDQAAEIIITSGEPLWVADARQDPRFVDDCLVTGPLKLRFYAGAPVRLRDGRTIGVICVVGREPRPFDEHLSRRLSDLAALVADECDRAIAAEIAARSAAELESTRALLSALVDTAPVSIVMTDRELRVLKASRYWLDAFGLTAAEAAGRSLYDIAPDQYPRFGRAYSRCLQGETIRTERLRWRRGDEAEKALQTVLTPWRGADGEIGGLLITANDVTALVDAMERAEKSEQRLQLALESARMHVLEVDFRNSTLEKAGAEELFYETPQTFESVRTDTLSVVHPLDRRRVSRELRRCIQRDEPHATEYRVLRSDGREVWASGVTRLVRDERGRMARLLCCMQDITPRKKAELALRHAKDEAEAANQAKSAFLATMSHEIRTPLNGVLGMAQAMATDELSPIQRERLEIVRQSGETLLALLNDVLDLSKIEAGKLELEEAAFDLDELAGGAHAVFTATAARKGLQFRLAVAEDAKGAYLGDATRVRQILYNLVSNALKFTETGEVRVRADRWQGKLRLTVSDTGIGIPADQLDRLFGKFEQADASTTRRYGGTGLGLAICRELAELMGGAITARSAEGQGAEFEVLLPLPWLGRDAGTPSPAPNEAAPAPAERPLRVLAAEDNPVNQLVLKTLLGQAGLEPVMVENGALALAAWEREPWDLILMDVQMPHMDGPTATRLIREREAALGRPRTPVVALTANAMAHQMAEYRAAGMDAFVAKPIDVAALFLAMQDALSPRNAATAAA